MHGSSVCHDVVIEQHNRLAIFQVYHKVIKTLTATSIKINEYTSLIGMISSMRKKAQVTISFLLYFFNFRLEMVLDVLAASPQSMKHLKRLVNIDVVIMN